MRYKVREIVGQEYIYEVDASSSAEAEDKVKRGEAGTAKYTQELYPRYTVFSMGGGTIKDGRRFR